MPAEDLWILIKFKVWAYALRCVDYHTAEDLISTFQAFVWRRVDAGLIKDWSKPRAVGYMICVFQSRVCDYARRREREASAIAAVAELATVTLQVPYEALDMICDVYSESERLGLDPRFATGLLEEKSHKEIMAEVGCSRATIHRWRSKLRDQMKQSRAPGRFLHEHVV